MIGKNINNVGAYYYGNKQYDESLLKHEEAFSYRKALLNEISIIGDDKTKESYNAELRKALTASYRVISSDYYMLGSLSVKSNKIQEGYSFYQKAYSNFKNYLGYIYFGDDFFYKNKESKCFFEIDSEKYDQIEKIQVINVLGTQIEILKLLKHKQINIVQEELEHLLSDIQVELQYFSSLIETNSRRKMSDTINKLNRKKKDIMDLFQEETVLNSFDISRIKELCEV